MKHKIFLISFCIATACCRVTAQGFFNQNGEIIKLYTQQLALLKTYDVALNEGYKIVEAGIGLTHDLKNGEFGLHSAYYTSLEIVNPQIKKYPYVSETISLYHKMVLASGSAYDSAARSTLFSADELQSLKTIYANLLKAADADMEELEQLTSDGKLKMTDDERIRRLNAVYKHIDQKYNDVNDIDNRVLLILDGRKQQLQKADALKKLYGF